MLRWPVETFLLINMSNDFLSCGRESNSGIWSFKGLYTFDSIRIGSSVKSYRRSDQPSNWKWENPKNGSGQGSEILSQKSGKSRKIMKSLTNPCKDTLLNIAEDAEPMLIFTIFTNRAMKEGQGRHVLIRMVCVVTERLKDRRPNFVIKWVFFVKYVFFYELKGASVPVVLNNKIN